MAKKKEEDLISQEIKRLTDLYKDLDGNKKKLAEGLIEESAFMRKTLKELKALIQLNGPLDEMEQGSYTILREHPALKSYNATIQRYSTIMKQLTDLLPKELAKMEDDGFDDFVIER